MMNYIPYHPWAWRIFLHEWLIFYGFHVGKYTIHIHTWMIWVWQKYISPIGIPMESTHDSEAKKRPSFAQELGQMQQFKHLGSIR